MHLCFLCCLFSHLECVLSLDTRVYILIKPYETQVMLCVCCDKTKAACLRVLKLDCLISWSFSTLRKCALSGVSRLCRHRIKLGDKGSYYYISPASRARVTIAPLWPSPDTLLLRAAPCHLVLVFTSLDHSSLQLFHLYPLHPAGPGETQWWDQICLHWRYYGICLVLLTCCVSCCCCCPSALLQRSRCSGRWCGFAEKWLWPS